jgi:nucleoside phosphorylase
MKKQIAYQLLSPQNSKRRKAVILTALPVEYKAVRKYLNNISEKTHLGTVYEKGDFVSEDQLWEIAISEIGPGNTTAAREAERALEFFKPSVVMLVGIAGGIKDVSLGDVVVATKVYGYESGKAANDFLPRPDLGKSSYNLIQRARAESKRDGWLKRLNQTGSGPLPKALVAPIAAGEKVISSKRSDTWNFIRKEYSDAVAVEMEGKGFLDAVFAFPEVYGLVVRGISDLISKKQQSDGNGWQDIASQSASAFAFEVLANLWSSKGKSVSSVPSRIKENVRWIMVLTGTIDEMDKPKIEAIVDHLRKVSRDADLTFKKLTLGSVILTFESTRSGFDMIKAEFDSHRLKEINGLKIEEIQEINIDTFIKMVQSRKEIGLEELIAKYYPLIGRAIRSVAINATKEEIEEAVDDVFVIIWNDIDKYDPSRSSFLNWVLMIAKYRGFILRRLLYKNQIQTISKSKTGNINTEKFEEQKNDINQSFSSSILDNFTSGERVELNRLHSLYQVESGNKVRPTNLEEN